MKLSDSVSVSLESLGSELGVPWLGVLRSELSVMLPSVLLRDKQLLLLLLLLLLRWRL